MPKIRITCDSTCDLTEELYRRFSVETIPLGVLLGEELRHDGVDVTVDELYSYVDKTGTLPKTSAISQFEYIERWKKYRDAGEEVIHINISSGISACYQNACLAAEELGGVYPVDSKLLSSGSGILVMCASKLAEEGMEVNQILERIEDLKTRIECSFVIDTLEYLKKGGRCSSLAAFGANLLKLHPEINMLNGTMDVGRKYRGGPEKFIPDYIKGRLGNRTDLDRSLYIVTHSKAAPEAVRKALEMGREAGFENIFETRAGSTISSHCGPGTLGIMVVKAK